MILPFCIAYIAAILVAITPKKLGQVVMVLAPIGMILTAYAGHGELALGSLLPSDTLFTFQALEGYPRLFAIAFSLTLLLGMIYALKTAHRMEIIAAFIYAGSALGVCSSGDLLTLFCFWEIMAIASTAVVLAGDSRKARHAAFRYAIAHFLGGVLLLVGIILQYSQVGHLGLPSFTAMTLADLWQNPAMGLICVGILVNIAAPPFCAWLPDAYPESSVTGSVFLSAFTTKTAVFVLLTLFAGSKILIPIGIFMIFYGIIYAILENDVRRILSYSIINQVGFMVTGVGIGTTMAMNGVAAHAFCHLIYKAVLLMSAGAVITQTGKNRCSDLGGLYHTMKFTMVCGIIGALAISAFPLTSGFVSKSLITSAAAKEHLAFVWFALIAASAGVFLHAGIKFPWFVFFQQDKNMRPPEAPLNMRVAMGLGAFLCIFLGVFAKPLYDLLPVETKYQAYTMEHVVTQLQLLLFAGFAFFALLPMLKRTETISLDMDWIIRKPARLLWKGLVAAIGAVYSKWLAFIALAAGLFSKMLHNGFAEHGVLSRSWSLSRVVTITVALLALLIMLYV